MFRIPFRMFNLRPRASQAAKTTQVRAPAVATTEDSVAMQPASVVVRAAASGPKEPSAPTIERASRPAAVSINQRAEADPSADIRDAVLRSARFAQGIPLASRRATSEQRLKSVKSPLLA